jgi:hypothetical protein
LNSGRSAAIVALFLIALAGSFVGTEPTVIGYASWCEDGLDNDGDGDVDIQDLACIRYPYEDNPSTDESFRATYSTDPNVVYLSMFEWHLANAGTVDEYNYAYCRAIQYGDYPTTEDAQRAYDYAVQNQINCANYP